VQVAFVASHSHSTPAQPLSLLRPKSNQKINLNQLDVSWLHLLQNKLLQSETSLGIKDLFKASTKGTNLIYHCNSKVVVITTKPSSEKSNKMDLAILSFVNLQKALNKVLLTLYPR
jgi:hypothetical protein